ncbi:hypothetical protein GCM10027059_06490 [Myceligenerans halotolerans]
MADRRDALLQVQAVAYRQAGYFTAAQAVEAGLSHQAQKYHVDRGNWLRVERGIFRLRDWPSQIEDVYVLWTLWSRGQGVISHASALAVHDLGLLDPGVITMTVPPRFRAKHSAVRVYQADLPSKDIEQRQGFRVTTPLRTLFDLAASDAGQEATDAAVADALDRGLASAGALRRRADEFGPRAALHIERALAGVSA